MSLFRSVQTGLDLNGHNLVISEPMVFRGIVVKQITFYPFQINLKTNQILINIEKYANTTAATIPIAICEAVLDAKLKINSLNKNLIVISDKQTKGRGRHGNKWISHPGNIYCSIALLINIPNDKLYKLATLTSVAIKNSLEHIGLIDILFKWPNDVFYKDSIILYKKYRCVYNNRRT